jgi:citrate synthase
VSQPQKVEKVSTRIWLEEPEPDNGFAARNAWLHGYDVYREMLGRAGWADMMYLLFRGEAPSKAQAALLEALSLALANAGPRDPAVHAAMCGAVGGSTAASCLMAALAVGAGQLGGGREVLTAMQAWERCGLDLDAWRRHLSSPPAEVASVWPATQHAPGFEAHGAGMAGIARHTLSCLASISPGPRLAWLFEHREALAGAAGSAPAMTGVAAAALADLGFTPAQGEMLYLLLRLPGAAAHALEQGETGHKKFPFFQLDLLDDPAKVTA